MLLEVLVNSREREEWMIKKFIELKTGVRGVSVVCCRYSRKDPWPFELKIGLVGVFLSAVHAELIADTLHHGLEDGVEVQLCDGVVLLGRGGKVYIELGAGCVIFSKRQAQRIGKTFNQLIRRAEDAKSTFSSPLISNGDVTHESLSLAVIR